MRKFVLAAAMVLLFALFVTYRARNYHYCASLDPRPQARIAGPDGVCGPNEEPLDVRRMGWFGRIRLGAKTAGKALGIE